MTTSPLAVRTVVTRSVTSSTVPIAGLAGWHREADDVPGTVLAFSDDEEAGRMSWTMRCAPNFWPTATMAAGATRLVLAMPRRRRAAMSTPAAQ